MPLAKHYNNLFSNSVDQIKGDNYQFDELIDSDEDNRFGITLLLRPDYRVRKKIGEFLDQLKEIEPNQYCYPDSDLHVTVMSIISCYNGFDLSQIGANEYIETIQNSISKFSGFNIHFKGITASTSCVMVQGFPENIVLNNIRDNLRQNFKNSTLQQSLDKRYAIQTAHSTIFRLRNKLQNKQQFLEMLDDYRNYDFGISKVDGFELVYNDWYQRKNKIKVLQKFSLFE